MKDRVTSHYIVSPNHDEVSSYNEVLETNYPPPPLINIKKNPGSSGMRRQPFCLKYKYGPCIMGI